ncbi:MAG: hypothetical protein M0038_22625 [Pseudomonadota bacterium]|jgi:hypothetical protein|nr:hypothetical protein [Pseudomonadota bacterium]
MVDEAQARQLKQQQREKEPSLELRRIAALEEIADTLDDIRGVLREIVNAVRLRKSSS